MKKTITLIPDFNNTNASVASAFFKVII